MKRQAQKVKNHKQTQTQREESGPLEDECTEQLKRDESKPFASEHINMEGGVCKFPSLVAAEASSSSLKLASVENNYYDLPLVEEDETEPFWEDGRIPVSSCTGPYDDNVGVTVEFVESPSSQKKNYKRFSAKEKESAELVHRVHLLCLLGRGRLVDAACNDPLIQASLLSLLPRELLKITEHAKLTTNVLTPLVKWFQNNFRVQGPSFREGHFQKNLALALESQEGTAEEVAALSVALMRALSLPVRYAFSLDVASLKPDADLSDSSNRDGVKLNARIPSSTMPTSMSCQAPSPQAIGPLSVKSAQQDSCPRKKKNMLRKNKTSVGSSVAGNISDENMGILAGELCSNVDDARNSTYSKTTPRKGDLEFEMHLQMALSATAVVHDGNSGSCSKGAGCSSDQSPPKKVKTGNEGCSSSISSNRGAVWSRKIGPPVYWAEVFCSGENLTGRWIHIDAAAGLTDGEQKVEAAAAACRKPLRYVVAFAGSGAKDVTRRYCAQWYKIAPHRICSEWWDSVLMPLKELEASGTGGFIDSKRCTENFFVEKRNKTEQHNSAGNSNEPGSSSTSPGVLKLAKFAENPEGHKNEEPDAITGMGSSINLSFATRDSLEDMELATRALTEPLPTNQQAYRKHPLYVLERWLTRYQVLHPKGPIIGYCSGHPVYPRGCVQTLHTKQMWLREGLQVKADEVPAKVVKRLSKHTEGQVSEPNILENASATTELYGKWQTEPLCLPCAVDGIVPKNERGHVDVWSEKCLPPGTIHLRLPRVVPVAKRLGVDFAPAMVGFEFCNGRSVPVFEGIVVCAEFKDAILEAYVEEEERREAVEKKRGEAMALSRWYQLLSSIVTRQRLRNSYEAPSSLHIQGAPPVKKSKIRISEDAVHTDVCGFPERPDHASSIQVAAPELPLVGGHEHTFPVENQSFDEETSVRTKRCPCGFLIQVEEL